MLPFSKDQLESIARWILTDSTNPVDEIQDLLHTHMLLEPKIFKDLWEDVLSGADEIEEY